MTASEPKLLRFKSQKSFAHRLVLATLTGKAIHISQIRPNSHSNPGLAPHEISFLRLLEAVTNGSHIEISYTGTTVVYKPGLIIGSTLGSGAVGGVIRHALPATCTRGVSYFIIPLCLLAPFSKAHINVLLTGDGVITSSTEEGDISVDSVRTAILPLYAQFGISNNIELRIIQRSNIGSNGRGGAGEVQLLFGHQVRLPKTVHSVKPGKIRKIRGVAYCTGVSTSNNARVIDEARGILNPLTPDTYIFSDVSSVPSLPLNHQSLSGHTRRTGVGFGLSLVAESSTGSLYSADAVSPTSGGTRPEEIGRQCAFKLLESIAQGGSVSMIAAPTVLTLMAMGSEDVSRLQMGKNVIGSQTMIDLARDLVLFGANTWAIRQVGDDAENDVFVNVVGRGVGNVGRKIA